MTFSKKSTYTINELIKFLNGEYKGNLNTDHKITGVTSIDQNDIDKLTFAENDKYIELAAKKARGLVLIKKGSKAEKIDNVLYVKNPRLAYAKAANLFKKIPYYNPGINKKAVIDDNVQIGKNVSIHPNVVIKEDVKIGDNTILGPGVVVDRNVSIGNNCIIYPNVVIERDSIIKNNVTINALSVVGSEGYGYVTEDNKHYHIPQLGNVIINDNVDIGANVTIDRGTQGPTIIGEGTKIDNQVQVAHNVIIGKNCLLVAQVGIAGSTVLGDNVIIAGKAGIIDHAEIGDNAIIGAASVVTNDVPAGSFYLGNPAQERNDELKRRALSRKLKDYRKKIKDIEKRLDKNFQS